MPGMELCCQPQQLRAACGWQVSLHGYLPWGLWEISVLLCGFEQLGSHDVCVRHVWARRVFCVWCVWGVWVNVWVLCCELFVGECRVCVYVVYGVCVY